MGIRFPSVSKGTLLCSKRNSLLRLRESDPLLRTLQRWPAVAELVRGNMNRRHDDSSLGDLLSS